MDVSSPIAAVIPSLDGGVLMALAGSTSAKSLNDVWHQTPGASKSGVRLALLRLASEGVVLQVPGGYILNQEHLAAPGVLALAGMRTDFLDRLREFVADQPDVLYCPGLHARRDGDSDSDIDVLLVTQATDAAQLAGELSDNVRRWTGNPCHVVVLSLADVRRMRGNQEPILEAWGQDLLVVTGDSRVLEGQT
jgi:hypothetical protein